MNEEEIQDTDDVPESEGDEQPQPPSQRNKWALVGLLGIAGIVLLFMQFRPGPEEAKASNADAQKTINAFLGNGRKNMTDLQDLLDRTAQTVSHFEQPLGGAAEPGKSLAKNPFMKPEAEALETVALNPKKGDARTIALQQAAALQLQSIMYSDTHRACLIDNRYRQVGDTVGDFTIERITPTAVVVRQSGFRFELKVAR
ncbi:MAG TPA: hypothetical protein VGB55_06730 [Tepidisphaeraceae bacterium]|jgi:hypothetical protein